VIIYIFWYLDFSVLFRWFFYFSGLLRRALYSSQWRKNWIFALLMQRFMITKKRIATPICDSQWQNMVYSILSFILPSLTLLLRKFVLQEWHKWKLCLCNNNTLFNYHKSSGLPRQFHWLAMTENAVSHIIMTQ
jgi:hypothetical protein